MPGYKSVILKINKSKDRMDEQSVVKYLELHPDFFETQLVLLQSMKVKHPSGNAVSLLEKQNSLLRDDASESKHKLTQLVAIAKKNERLFYNLRQTVMGLIEQTDLNALSMQLEFCLTTLFETGSVRIFLFNKQGDMEDKWLWVDRNLLEEYMPTLLVTDQCQCGEFDQDKRMFLFGDAKIKSAAIAPLISNDGEAHGLIALGSNEQDYFTNKMDTMFLQFLAQTFARLVQKLV